jgi:asparagine synthase (glutamine-hydrolysing)
MCGIAGKLLFDRTAAVDASLAAQMAEVIAHRGPDDQGTWAEGPIALASRRLAVLDLSSRGHQPMASADGCVRLVYNGEIYNFRQLREELQQHGHRFQSDTDTEVLLRSYEQYGIECLQRLRGMFAFALWDERHRRLVIARDRLGKKPLFYHQDSHGLVFGSEPKSILRDRAVSVGVDRDAIHQYLTWGYVPAPWSAFSGIRKLPPGHYLAVENGRVTIAPYWRLSYARKRVDDEATLAAELLHLLEESTRLRLISDVPLGALLSGGIDSSAVVALMRRVSNGPIKTFSIGFDEKQYDESEYARAVARHLGTEHHELFVRPDASTLLPRLVWHYNEPFADSSAVPSFAVCAMARQHVTVALTGDGGDESFLGYDRYAAAHVAQSFDRLPSAVRPLVRPLKHLSGDPKSLSHRVRRLAEALDDAPRARYARWMQAFTDADKAELYTPEFASEHNASACELLERHFEASDASDFVEQAVNTDVAMYLPDDLLVKTDIASMAHSLEVRCPLLDHHIVEFAAALPRRFKLRRLTQKHLLKRVVSPFLPPEIERRPKMGFGVPIGAWLRGELREMAYDILLDRRATARGYFRPQAVRGYLDDHSAGRAHRHTQIWALLMLELWHRMWVDDEPPLAPPGKPSVDERHVTAT